jgi:pimeloyl-ACP methyl ester carboxylesterase
MPRSAADIVADLRALLAAAGVHPPYVLVGHSFGGLVVRLFVSTVPPDEVVGLVLVDAAQEEFWTKLREGMITGTPPEPAEAAGELFGRAGEDLAELPRRVGGARARGPARGRHQERALHPDHGAGFGDRCSASSGRGCPPGLVGGCHPGSSLVGPGAADCSNGTPPERRAEQ